jgi:hypothetical protein
MSSPLPSRPRLGRRERWLLVAVLLGTGQGIAGAHGYAMPESTLTMIVTSILGFVAADSYRPSGMSKGES